MAQITLRDYLQETEDAISSKRVDEALASCQYILAYFPESLETQRLLGEVYLAQGKLEDAQQAFDWVLTNDPENVVAYCSRALVSERLSDHDTALDCYQQAYELSRGNSQIRQAFNQLSEKAGQPGFMLSRAGLARLYMRGDLLSQAAQEWDVVLAMTPDRLDARTGLLEVYWRLGIYDRAAQLAEQILQDVPGCVKALLLLAYVTAPQDMLRSQELVKKAEVVDPDLVMAHDLFADQMVSRQGDPFLKLLNKSPVAISTGDQAAPIPAAQNADPFAALNSSVGTVSSASLASWGSNASWSNDTTLVKPRSDTAFPAESGAAAFPSWMSEGLTSSNKPSIPVESNSDTSTSQWGSETWNPVSLSQSAPLQEADVAPVEPWDSLQDALNNISPEVVRQISDPGLPASADVSWLGTDALAAPSLYAESTSNGVQNVDGNINTSFAYEGENSWSFATPVENESNNSSATPAWLNMLTQNEQQVKELQSSDFSVDPTSLKFVEPDAVQPQAQPQIAPSSQPPVAQVQPQVSLPSQPPVAQVQPPVSPPLQQPSVAQSQPTSEEVPERAREVQSDADGDEGIFFGPDWLKTLGAASLDGSEPFDFSVPEEYVPVVREQPVTLEQKPEEVSSSWDQPELQTSSQKSEEPSHFSPSEEPQNTQEEDAWASWQPASSYSSPADQEVYQPWPDLSNQSQDDQSFWSLPQQENPVSSNQEQPSWMSQLSQSGQGTPVSEYTDWASQSAESWNAGSQEMQIPAEPGFQEHQSTPDQTYSDDLWTTHTEQPAPVSSQDEQDPWAQLSQQMQSKSIDYNWLAQLAGHQQSIEPASVQEEPALNAISGLSQVQQNVPSNQEKTEQDLVTTLEELEHNLLSHGFMPLEPNSLANIAQASQEEYRARPSVEAFSATAANEQAEPSLSSALAELGNFGRSEAASPVGSSNNESLSIQQPEVRQKQTQPSEPLWLSSLGTVPDAAFPSVSQVTAPKKPAEDTTVRASAVPDSARVRQPTNPLLAVPYTENESAFAPTNPALAPAPAMRMNVLLDSELETTMKRPAVRLQPMQQQATARDHGGNSHSSRGRTGERAGQRLPDSKGGNVSYRERLVRGYQAQLIGDFDEAMQEYRLIIRNAPELLGEVVSNVRALLRLAPNYSAGYRVLGDAYMRQGEYLQAMESYNKALTMAKKAKS